MLNKILDYFKFTRLEPDPVQYAIGSPINEPLHPKESVEPRSRLAPTIPHQDKSYFDTIFNSEGNYTRSEPTPEKETKPAQKKEKTSKADVILYHLRRHVKYFYKRAYKQAVGAVFLSALLINGPPGKVALVLTGGLLACCFWVYREYYGWQHFSLEINLYEVILHVPENRWLFFQGRGGIRVLSRKVTSCLPGGFTFSEQWIFGKKCRTMTLDTEVEYDGPIHNMTDVKSPELLQEAVLELAKHYGRA